MKKNKAAELLLPTLFGIIILILLQSGIIHALFRIKPLQLPYPLDIASAFAASFDKILQNTAVTAVPAVSGLILGSALGFAAAIFISAFENAGYGFLFLMTALNSVPVLALAPLMNRWFSNAFLAKLAVITVACSGVMSVNAFRGLSDIPPSLLDLAHTNAAKKKTIFLKLRIPNSVPYVFTALKTGLCSAMLAAIISEFFSKQTSGLGYMIKYSLKVGNQKQIGWAYIVAVSILSMLLYAVISLSERHFTKWHVSQRKK